MTDEQASGALATGPAAPHDALPGGAAPADAADSAAVDASTLPADVFARRRAELGLSLDDVANQLKFSARQIEALEVGDFERLPGGTFVRGMMRSYARLLKLEPGEISEQLTAAGAKPQTSLVQAVSLRAPIPFSEGGKHVNLVYMLLSVLILAAVSFFAIHWYQESRGGGKLAFVRPVAVGSSGAQALVKDPGASQPFASSSPAPEPEAARFASAGPAPPAETAPAADEKSVVPSATPAIGAGKGRITLRFEAESWVLIKAANGTILMSQLNPAGTEKVIEGDPPFDITIGNAPRVRLFYNDKPIDLKPHYNVDVARLTLN